MITKSWQEKLDSLKKWLVKYWGTPEELELNRIKKRLNRKFTDMAEPMDKVEYTRENYDRLFPYNKVSTPIGEKELRHDQFEKLDRKKRKEYLGGMKQTYNDPIAIISLNRKGEQSKLLGKSFNDNLPENKILMSAINKKNKGVTTHDRDINNFLNKIKKPADLLYEKQISGDVDTAGNDTYVRDLAITGDTQSPTNIPQTTPKVNGKNDKNLRKE
jgi:hypothetical protein